MEETLHEFKKTLSLKTKEEKIFETGRQERYCAAAFVIFSFAKGLGLDFNSPVMILFILLAAPYYIMAWATLYLTKREACAVAVLIALAVVSFCFSRKITLLFSVMLLAVMKNVDFHRLLSMVFRARLLAFTFVLLSYGIEIIQKPGLLKEFPLTLGFVHKNTGAMQILFLLCLYIYLNYNRFSLKKWLGLVALSVVVFLLTNSRTSLITMLLALTLWAAFFISIKFKNRFVKYSIILSPIVLFALIFSISLFYERGGALEETNKLLSSRLNLGNWFIEEYSLSVIGSQIEEGVLADVGYKRIDSGYMSLIMSNGIIWTVIYLAASAALLRKYYKSRKAPEIIVTLVFLVFFVSEGYLSNILVNLPLIFLADIIFPERSLRDGESLAEKIT